MSNNIDESDSQSAASNYTVVSRPDSHDTNTPLPHDTTAVAEDKATSKPATGPSDTDMPQDRHAPALRPLSQSKSPSSSTPPLRQTLAMSSPQPQLSIAPLSSLPVSPTKPAAHYQPPDIDVDASTSSAATRRPSSLPPPPLPSIPIHVKRDMQHMRRASTSQKEMFQFFPQVPAE